VVKPEATMHSKLDGGLIRSPKLLEDSDVNDLNDLNSAVEDEFEICLDALRENSNRSRDDLSDILQSGRLSFIVS